ncbi:MAG: hypothetical protein ACR2N7_08775, partial [Acidimicrobiia bacterium]
MKLWFVRNGEHEVPSVVTDILAEVNDSDVIELAGEADWRVAYPSHIEQLDEFSHTPAPLVTAWRAARQIESIAAVDDVVVFPDEGGVGGVFALQEAMKRPGDRRHVWTIATGSSVLTSLLVAGTIDYEVMPDASQVDWELAQYRFSAEVIAISALAVDLLASLDCEASMLDLAEALDPEADNSGHGVWVPGPVSRRNRSGDVLRSMASLPNVRVTTSDRDVDDGVMTGTTWESLSAIRGVLGDRVSRSQTPPSNPSAVVIGDAFEIPDIDTRALRDRGVLMVVPRGSVASNLWPRAPVWESSDDILTALEGMPVEGSGRSHSLWAYRSPVRFSEDSKNQMSVSVGVPVFRNAAYLDECIESILHQTLPPAE